MKDEASLSDLVRSSELREQFGITQNVINGWCDDGLSFIRVGRERCFFVDELLAFLSEHRRQLSAPARRATRM